MTNCLFCGVAAGTIPADVVLRTDQVVAFRDINPQAPVHLLVIPVAHHRDAGALAAADPLLAGQVIQAAQSAAELQGLTDYRLVFNTGEHAGQSVFHAHAHVLGGRSLTWPPG